MRDCRFYGKKLLPELSKRLTKELGRGYSRSNLQNMRLLYHEYPEICQITSGKLTWSHYLELLAVTDNDARAFYEHECMNSKWSVKELSRQIGTSLFERLLLSDGKANKEKVLALANYPLQDKQGCGCRVCSWRFEQSGVRVKLRLLYPGQGIANRRSQSPAGAGKQRKRGNNRWR
jgi:hypothetical protein